MIRERAKLVIIFTFWLGPIGMSFSSAGDVIVQPETVLPHAGAGKSESISMDEMLDSSGRVLDQAQAGAEQAWDATKDRSAKTLEYTKQKAGAAWSVTKEGSAAAAEYTVEKTGQAWDKTKQVSGDVAGATKASAQKAGVTVKDAYETAKEKVKGGEE